MPSRCKIPETTSYFLHRATKLLFVEGNSTGKMQCSLYILMAVANAGSISGSLGKEDVVFREQNYKSECIQLQVNYILGILAAKH